MKISFKFLIIIILITVLLGLTALTGLFVSTNLLEQQINGRYLAISTYAVEKVHRLFSRRAEEMRDLANEPAFRKRNTSQSDIANLLLEYKNHRVSSSAPFLSISFFDLDGTCLASTDVRKPDTRQPFSGYRRKIAEGQDFAMEVSDSGSLAGPFFELTQVVRDYNQNPWGVLVSSLPMSILQPIAERPLKLFELGHVPDLDLIDRKGLLIYSSHNKAGILKEISPESKLIMEEVEAGKQSGTKLIAGSGGSKADRILIFAQETADENFRGNDWTLIISLPKRIALSSIIELQNRMAMVIVLIACLCAGIAIILAKTITRPIALLSEAATKVGDGQLDTVVEISPGGEIGRLAEKFNSMVKKLAELNHALQIAATVDKLTGALNRGKTEEILAVEMARARRHRHPLSMILLDLDYFKKVNDTYGHQVGDKVLKSVVTAIKANIRISDALGRWGGEEFILLLPETNVKQALEVAEKVRINVEQCAPPEVGRVTISCGVAEMAEGDSDDSLIKRADDALYSAKRKGRNQVELGPRPELGVKQLTLPVSPGSPPNSPTSAFRTPGKGP